MKKICLVSFGLVFLFLSQLNATVLTVSNNVEKPAQYTDIQAAHDAAQFGDTILVTGSALIYSSAVISKSLVFIGAGSNKPVDEQSEINVFTLEEGSSNIKFIGFVIRTITINGSGWLSCRNIIIEKCQITYKFSITYGSSGYLPVTQDVIIRNCIFSNASVNFTYGYYKDVIIHNNIFDNSRIHSNSLTLNVENIIFKNNLFINSYSNIFENTFKLIVENNIFYKSEPQGCTSCAFNHNNTYGNTNDLIPGPDNLGTGNIIGINPEFISYPEFGATFDYIYNFDLEATSPLKNSGTDGSDIGIYGGMMPFIVGLNPPIPVMLELTLPENQSAVKQGGTISVSFKATKQ